MRTKLNVGFTMKSTNTTNGTFTKYTYDEVNSEVFATSFPFENAMAFLFEILALGIYTAGYTYFLKDYFIQCNCRKYLIKKMNKVRRIKPLTSVPPGT